MTNEMQNINESIREIIHLLKNKRLAIFCGAGISINSPSNLPSSSEFRSALVEQIFDVKSLNGEVKYRLKHGCARMISRS